MLRCRSLLISVVLALTLSGVAQAAVTVFQDPTDTGTPGAPAATVTVGGAAVPLNLYYQTGNVASTPSSAKCLSGTGDEVCGWDIHVSTSSPSVVLQSFTPEAGSDTVFGIANTVSGFVLRANGGNPLVGELGTHRIGTLLVSATGPGSVTVSGNLFVTAALAAAPVTTGNVLATATGGGPDPDGDGVLDPADNCPTVANADQADGDGDLVGNVCDNCTTLANPRIADIPAFLSANTWATLTGGQRDDDHDGFGNRCDADFTATGALVGSADLVQFRASSGKNRTGDTCGTEGTRPCAAFDLDETGLLIGSSDLTIYRSLSGKAAGPRCTTCPLACNAGSTGACN